MRCPPLLLCASSLYSSLAPEVHFVCRCAALRFVRAVCTAVSLFLAAESGSSYAWICAQRATDRDLESSSTRRRGMLGYVLVRQPTVIFRVFVNAWIRTCQATDRDLEGVST